ALSGVFPFAGFWSKDAILGAIHDKVHAIEHEQAHRASHANGADNSHASGDDHAHSSHAATPGVLHNWSDDKLATSRGIYQWLYYGAMLAAFLTAFYT